MQPTNLRILDGLRGALDEIERQGLSGESAALLAPMRLALNELMLRENREFFREHCRQGLGLLASGAALAGGHGIVARPAQTGEQDLALAEPAQLETVRLALAERIGTLVVALVPLERDYPELGAWLAEVVDWENSLYRYRLTQIPQAADPQDRREAADRFTPEVIANYLSARIPERAPVAVENLRKLAGGFSKTTVLFDARYADDEVASLVIRADPRDRLILMEGAEVAKEFYALRLVHAAGHPVAEPLWLETDARILGGPFLVSRKGPGHNIGTRVDIGAELDEGLLRDFIACLVRIHDTPLDPADRNLAASHLAPIARLDGMRAVIAAQVDQWRQGIIDFALPPSPLRERALEWLARNIPAYDDGDAPALLHGDYGLHNVLVDKGRVSCVLDWESSGIGDPADDLAWLLDALRAHVAPERIVALYEEMSGRRISAERLRYFEVFNALRFIVTCPRALDLFQGNPAAGIGALDLGLRFTIFGTGKLNQTIAAAQTPTREDANAPH